MVVTSSTRRRHSRSIMSITRSTSALSRCARSGSAGIGAGERGGADEVGGSDGDGADATVVQETVPVEDHPADALLAATLGGEQPDLLNKVVLMTVKQAKGLEFDAVLVVQPAEIIAESPRGLSDLYVAVTRATRRLAETSGPGPDGHFWERRALRAHIIGAEPELRGRARASYHPFEHVLAEAIGQDLGQPGNALIPRLAALSAVAGLRELYESDEAHALAAPPSAAEGEIASSERAAAGVTGAEASAIPSCRGAGTRDRG